MDISRRNFLAALIAALGLGAGAAGTVHLLDRREGGAAAAPTSTTAGTTTTSSAPTTSSSTTAAPTTTSSTTSATTSTTTSTTTTTTTTSTTLPPPAVSIPVICREAWGAVALPFEPPTHTIERLTVHHTAVAFGSNTEAPGRARAYQRFHMEQGWADMAYHFMIDAHGHVYGARPVQYVGDTFTSYDPAGHFLAMCDGHFDEQSIPEPQLQALADLLAWASAEYGVSLDTIAGHRDYASTSCPGNDLYDKLSRVRRMAEERVAAGGAELVPVCGDEAADLIAAIEAGTDEVVSGA